MFKKIHILSEQTIDQIAAGEVIENPASVVKELFENAVDAGASHIVIETLGGGFQSIRISDDGSGMSDEDALLCLKRHATSKISSVGDLMQLHTMGFRGEALASIAAISEMSLTTAMQDGLGLEVQVERRNHCLGSALCTPSRNDHRSALIILQCACAQKISKDSSCKQRRDHSHRDASRLGPPSYWR